MMTEDALRKEVIKALKNVYDPELLVDIYELGLIYKIDLDLPRKKVNILMTLTTPNCPEAESIPAKVKQALLSLPPIKEAVVEITFEPPYDPANLSQATKLALGLV